MNLLIIGSVAFDSIKTPFESVEGTLGGSATFCSLAASFFTQPGIVAVVGEDFTSGHKKVLTNKNIDLEGLEQAPGKSFAWGGEYSFDLNSRTTLFTNLNVFENFQPKVPENYKKSEYVFLGNIHPLLQKDVLSQTTHTKFVGLDTMNYWIEKALPELKEVLRFVNILIINDSEAREFTHEHNLLKASKKILGIMDLMRQPILIIKRGENGLSMFQGSHIFSLPAYPLEDVADPTGAGDSFAGGFMGYITQTENTNWENLKLACVYGSIMASFSVEKLGTERLQEITQDEITRRFQDFKNLTHFEMNHPAAELLGINCN